VSVDLIHRFLSLKDKEVSRKDALRPLTLLDVLFTFLTSGLLCLAMIVLNYIFVPSFCAVFIVGLYAFGWFLNHDHVPIGMHGFLVMRWAFQEGKAPPPGVPRWIARIAAKGTEGRRLGFLFLALLCSPIVMALSVISHGISKGSVRLRWKSAIRADLQQITLYARHDKKCLAARVIRRVSDAPRARCSR